MTSSAPAPGLASDRKVLVPKKGVDAKKWAVIACDQFTSQPEYWEKADQLVGQAPSTLRMIYPEVYLSEGEAAKAKRIDGIHDAMQSYLAQGDVFADAEWPIYVERSVLGRTHHGVVLAVDLDRYTFGRASESLIRPTEETIVERLPPRMRIRRGAPLETPHILLLIDDPERTVVEPLAPAAAAGALAELYSTDLMLDGGHVRGWAVAGPQRAAFFTAITRLADPERQRKKYGEAAAAHPLVFAVGDGNHSLATAKSIWEERKAAGDDPVNSPARFALVELCNVHDEALIFEPIHRVLDGNRAPEVLARLKAHFGARLSVEEVPRAQVVPRVLAHGNAAPHTFGFVTKAMSAIVTVSGSDKPLVVATVQSALDAIVKDLSLGIDYIHGEDVTLDLGSKDAHHCGIILPPMQKAELFPTVVKAGIVPRKTFSMGHANEKRYYMECRKIM